MICARRSLTSKNCARISQAVPTPSSLNKYESKGPDFGRGKKRGHLVLQPGQSNSILPYLNWCHGAQNPCFDPSDEIMKSHRPVHSGGGTVLDTEGTTILRFRLTTREQTTSTAEN